MFKIIRKKDALVRKIATNKSATDYITRELSKDVSLTVLKATNYTSEFTPAQDFIYFVLNGTLRLSFNSKEVELSKDDVCFVTKGTSYIMKGTFEAIVVSQPAFIG